MYFQVVSAVILEGFVVVVCCLLADLVAGSSLGGSDIEEVLRYRDGYCLLSGEAININGLTRCQNFSTKSKLFEIPDTLTNQLIITT